MRDSLGFALLCFAGLLLMPFVLTAIFDGQLFDAVKELIARHRKPRP